MPLIGSWCHGTKESNWGGLSDVTTNETLGCSLYKKNWRAHCARLTIIIGIANRLVILLHWVYKWKQLFSSATDNMARNMPSNARTDQLKAVWQRQVTACPGALKFACKLEINRHLTRVQTRPPLAIGSYTLYRYTYLSWSVGFAFLIRSSQETHYAGTSNMQT